MKKKLILIFLLCFMSAFLFAYGDTSGAEYIGKESEINLNDCLTFLRNEMIMKSNRTGLTVYKIEKLTKNEQNLLGKALEAYRLKTGEIYTVQIGELSTNPTRILKILVRIDKLYNNGQSWDYSWWSIGKVYTGTF